VISLLIIYNIIRDLIWR